MATSSDKDIENARHVENVSKHEDSDGSLGNGKSELQTLDKPELEPDDVLLNLPEAEKKRVLRKVDWRLVSTQVFIFACFS